MKGALIRILQKAICSQIIHEFNFDDFHKVDYYVGICPGKY